MGLTAVSKKAGVGAAGLSAIGQAVYEIQGLRQDIVAGAEDGTKMAIASMAPEDKIVGIVAFPTAGGAPIVPEGVSQAALGASGTITVASVVDGDYVDVDGVRFTFKSAPTSIQHVLLDAEATDEENAQALVDTIEAYKHSYGRGNSRGSLSYTPSADGDVVTITANAKGTSGNAITLTSSNGARLAVSGSGTLTGGTTTGGFTSTTDLTGYTVVVTWIDVDR